MFSVEYLKDPDADLDYGVDWSDWLQSGEVISTSSWTVPAGITTHDEAKTDTGTTIWASGGTVKTSYDLTNKIVTDAARTDERTIRITVEQR